MARDSLRSYASFATRTGRGIGFTRCGVLSIGAPGAQAALIERNVAAMRECGVEVERVDAARLRELVPGIDVAPDTIAAFEPAGGYVDPQRTCQAFAAHARSRGATLREGARVVRWFVEHGRAVAVEVECAGVAQRVRVPARGRRRRGPGRARCSSCSACDCRCVRCGLSNTSSACSQLGPAPQRRTASHPRSGSTRASLRRASRELRTPCCSISSAATTRVASRHAAARASGRSTTRAIENSTIRTRSTSVWERSSRPGRASVCVRACRRTTTRPTWTRKLRGTRSLRTRKP